MLDMYWICVQLPDLCATSTHTRTHIQRFIYTHTLATHNLTKKKHRLDAWGMHCACDYVSVYRYEMI